MPEGGRKGSKELRKGLTEVGGGRQCWREFAEDRKSLTEGDNFGGSSRRIDRAWGGGQFKRKLRKGRRSLESADK